jgi:hypothetical protein
MPRSQGLVGSSPTSGTGTERKIAHAMHVAPRLLRIFVMLLSLAVAESALAQSREFAGRVVSISAQSIVVKDRRGETATFGRAERTAVEGKQNWEAIAPGDSVLVRWKLGDGSAWRVIVLESGGER